MYTNIPSVQILISLLKQFNIRHLVLSPGTRNTALSHSVESDSFFRCYSIVDERSAAFVALGIAEAMDAPVCVSCTAATATCNYMPAVKEAYERNLQLVALTADQDSYTMFHMEDQCINQVDMYQGFVKRAVDVPKVENEDDYWYCNRCMNEAFLELDHHGKGPIQINYHMQYDLDALASFPLLQLPQTRKIERVENIKDSTQWKKLLLQKKKILVVCGSSTVNMEFKRQLREFHDNYNCAIVYDTFSNIADVDFILPKCLGDLNYALSSESRKQIEPELIITVGNVFYSNIKNILSTYRGHTENWQISIDGMVNDGYRTLSTVFECQPETFFLYMNENANSINDGTYRSKWEELVEKMTLPDLQFTNFKVIDTFCKKIPANSTLHASVLDSIRMSNYVEMHPSVECFANIGADGIDGAVSALFGQASNNENLAFLLIGDLSFMYDMNAIIGEIGMNIRILVINNFAGAEFHKNFGIEKIPTINLHIAAGHKTKIQHCAQMADIDYLEASDMESLNNALDQFVSINDRAILLEVFTDAIKDAAILKKYWQDNKSHMPMNKKEKIKNFVREMIGQGNILKIKKLIKK